MRQDGYQFGAWEGLDNRKWLYRTLRDLGHGLSEEEAGRVRAAFLQRLLAGSENGFAGKLLGSTPLPPLAAYSAFAALTGVLGVPLEGAARLLEQEARKR